MSRHLFKISRRRRERRKRRERIGLLAKDAARYRERLKGVFR